MGAISVAILGYGIEGESAYRFFKAQGAQITVHDQAETPKRNLPDDVKFIGGKESFSDLHGYDYVVRTPAINPANIATDGEITSVTRLFFEHCPAPIIGVTGTKGKGTTSSLIAVMLEQAGKRVQLGGNIGKPALDLLGDTAPDDIVVLELSSFQLWDLQYSPHVAVVLMVDEDHLDIHGNLENYITAKGNIARWQSPEDIVIFHPTNERSARIAGLSPGTKSRYGVAPAAHVEQEAIYIQGQKLCALSSVRLPGAHNIENVCAAATAAWQFVEDSVAIGRAIEMFAGLEHRQEKVREFEGVTYINDSFSSAPAATVVALAAYTRPKILIVGGYDRGGDFLDLANIIAADTSIKKVLIIGQTGEKIARALGKLHYETFTHYDDVSFSQVIADARASAISGDVVILSPGCPSFDMFANFSERGQEFKRIVGEMV